MRIEIRRIRIDEGDALMRTRLMALLDSPFAFAATYVDEVQRPGEAWADRARAAASGTAQTVFAAVGPDGWMGMVGAYTPEDPASRRLYGMWVEPAVRGQGLGASLAGTVIAWADRAGANAVTLWVAESNEPALGLYRSLGFETTDVTQPMPSDETVTEILMRRSI